MALMAHVARSIVEGFRLLGLPADAIARRCGVSVEGDLSPFAVLPDSTYLALWREALAAAPGRNTLALEVGLALPFGAAGPLDYLFASSATMGASLRVLQRSFRLAANDVWLEIDDSRGGEIAVVIVNAPLFEGSWWSDELICGLLVSRGRAAVPAMAEAGRLRLDLARPCPRNADRWRALLKGPLRFGSRHSALYFPRLALDMPLRTADRHLVATMLSLVGIPADHPLSVVPALRAHLKVHLEGSRQSARAAARSMGMSLRTLQRQLTDQGLTFRAVLDDLRKEQAELLLSDRSDRSPRVSEVAHRLGFAEQASFTRAFRRWTGLSPQRWRAVSTVEATQKVRPATGASIPRPARRANPLFPSANRGGKKPE